MPVEGKVGWVMVEVLLGLIPFSPSVRTVVGVSQEDLGVGGEVPPSNVDLAASEQAVLVALVRVSKPSYPSTVESVEEGIGSAWL